MIGMSPTAQTRPQSVRRALSAAPFLVAARGGRPAWLPVWFMRQAGRSLPEYRALREGVPMLDACFDPEMLAEITIQPVRRHGVDAAILFSDIVVPLKAAGVDIDIVPGTGPVVAAPIRTPDAVRALPVLEPDHVSRVADGVRLLVESLGETPLIGFAGAPFTLASYLIEGGPSRNHEHTKALMHSEPALWHALAGRLADLALTHRLPAMFGFREFTELGGLISYGASVSEMWRRAAPYVDKILRGADPGELPIDQPTRFELIVNVKTAKTLGIQVPASLLVRADKVIE